MFHIEPYQGALPLALGMSEQQLRAILGNPDRVFTNRRGELEYQYRDCSVRFEPSTGGAVEVGFLPSAGVWLGDINVFEDDRALEKLSSADGSPFECFGFIILLELGMSLTGFHDDDESQKAVTVFTRGRWDHLRDRLAKYSGRR
jgi:hypothetical protein